MGMWPFRRKSNRRKSAGGAENTEARMHDIGPQRDLAKQIGTELASTGPERRRSRRDQKRKSSRESKKLQRDPERRRTYSFSPGRNDSIRVPQDVNRPPVPPLPPNVKGSANRSKTEKQEKDPAITKAYRSSTQPLESTLQDWQRMPTLHKRSAQDLARRKSSKKRKEEHDREVEIKAMVAFLPTRPAADPDSSGRPMKRESRKMKEGFNRNLENPSSDISLPLAESLHSSMSSDSERRTSYKLSAMLAPRPTIRYSENPRYAPGASGFGSDRSDSKRRASERVSLPADILKANKRVDDLADDLNAGELRELMERDQKRREKKKIADRIKLEKRLARRQEKQKADEAAAVRDGTPPPQNMERGVFGREVIVGLGIDTPVVTSAKRKGSTGSDSGREKRSPDTFRQPSTTNDHQPISDVQRNSTLASESFTHGSDASDPVAKTDTVLAVNRANAPPNSEPRAHARGASGLSQMMDLSKPESSIPVKPRPIPETSTKASQSSWTSFFKLRARNKRVPTQSSFSNTSRDFSNTSRDSMQNGQGPQIAYAPIKVTSNIPKRTMSKFREDLPELPISPPDSRVQSPEADVVPPIPSSNPEKKSGNRTSIEDSRVRYDTPTSGYKSIDAVRLRDETPTSGRRSVDVSSPEPPAALSQSLASIDSEGSWLSGRKASSKRGSSQMQNHPIRDSASSLHRKYREFGDSTEELGIAEDEYFSRLTPGPEDKYKSQRQSTGNPMPSSDEEDGSIASPVSSEKSKWGAVARQPTVVHREALGAKSREGLLNEFDDESMTEAHAETPIDSKRKSYITNQDIMEDEESGVHRATSIDLGHRHVRHISAGSARLLELKPKDGRRISSG